MSWLVFDIETAPCDGVDDYLDSVEAPANYKDPIKIEAYKVEKRAQIIERAALDCDLARIVAIGFKRPRSGAEVFLAENERHEKQALAAFWHAWRTGDGPNISFNCFYFDLPVLLRRSQLLHVDTPEVSLDKYRSPVIDLMQFLTWRGLVNGKSLDFYCKRFGLDVPEDHISGSDIPALVVSGEWDRIEQHCRTDVLKVEALAIRLGLIQASTIEPVEAA